MNQSHENKNTQTRIVLVSVTRTMLVSLTRTMLVSLTRTMLVRSPATSANKNGINALDWIQDMVGLF